MNERNTKKKCNQSMHIAGLNKKKLKVSIFLCMKKTTIKHKKRRNLIHSEKTRYIFLSKEEKKT
jgi:hypothetical protein